MGALTEPNVPIRHEDLGDVMTYVEPAKKPFTTMVPKGPKPKDTIFFDTIDKEDSARLGGVSDGSSIDRTNLEDPSANHGKIGGRIQVHQRTLGVGFIAMANTDPAGVADWYVKGVAKKLSETKGDMEMTYLSEQESRDSADLSGTQLSDLTRGAGRYIEDGAPIDTAATIPTAYRNDAAHIASITALSGYTRATLDGQLKVIHDENGSSFMSLNGFVTSDMLLRIQSFFTEFKAVDGEVPLQRYNQDGAADTVKIAVTRYINSFAQVDFMPSGYLGGIRSYTGSSGLAASTTNTSTAVSLSAAFSDAQGKPGLQVGMRVYGTGIPAGAYITAINSNKTGFTLSAAATATGTPTLYFGAITHGYLLDMNTWEQRPTLNPGHTELPVDGAGKHGFIRAIAGLRCRRPRSNAKIITKATALS